MGQDFINKRNERCARLQELHYEKRFREPDLFSNVLPTVVEPFIELLDDDHTLDVGDELWHNPDDMEFFKGGKPAVRMSEEHAAIIRELEETHKVPLHLRVTGIDVDCGAAELVLLSPNKVH